MDDVKDITARDNLLRFLNSTTIRTSSFGSNIAGERAYLRAERIAAAIHLVTNHISSDEPLRNSCRRSSILLLENLLELRYEMRNAEAPHLKKVQALVRELISVLRILVIAGRVSPQNAEVIITALDDLGVSLATSQRTALSETISLNREDFVPVTTQSTVSDTRRKVARHVKDNALKVNATLNKGERFGSRSNEIVGILSAHGQLGIKNITANMPEYSEKMVQRELRKLVSLGRVKKAGSKRWSVYSLAQQ